MAGYIGSKTSVTQVDGYNRTEADDEFVNDPNSVITVSGSNVGIGTSSPNVNLEVAGSSAQVFFNNTDATGNGSHDFSVTALKPGTGFNNLNIGSYETRFKVGGSQTEAARIDSSGNLLVGKTSTSSASAGVVLQSSGLTLITRDDATPASIRRNTSDGDLLSFSKDGSTVGSIGVVSGLYTYFNSQNNTGFLASNGTLYYAWNTANFYPQSDNARDLGLSSRRWDDVYATNGTIQTSDRNEKQDIEALSDAEQRVAVVCKGLLRKFRWIDSVAEKGDDARIHFGIIAQDLQDAFAAEGLDAGRYAMFISSTWWETQTDVPAVEAVAEVLDEEGNVVTEAVEAKEAYTRTDTYETLEEAPEGATERTRLGVRYPELLAFIIGAM
jgi:hypothetical protein